MGDDHHDSLYYNCLSYALGLESLVILEEYEEGNDIDQVASLTIDKVNSLGMSIRPIEGPDSPIFSYEYRIAVSVGPSDYHYMVQNSDASWSHKAGQLPPALVDAVNPDYASWDSYQTKALFYNGFFVRFIIVGITPNYYNGGIRYFAVSIGGQ